MSFTVNHESVRSFAGTVAVLTDDADRTVRYAREHLGIGYAEGRMFATVVETATSVRDQRPRSPGRELHRPGQTDGRL